jgi:hypothetical protein
MKSLHLLRIIAAAVIAITCTQAQPVEGSVRNVQQKDGSW